MKALSKRNYELIGGGARMCGTFDPEEILPIIEEELYCDEIDEIECFLQWMHDNDVVMGRANYKDRFAHFKAGTIPEPLGY